EHSGAEQAIGEGTRTRRSEDFAQQIVGEGMPGDAAPGRILRRVHVESETATRKCVTGLVIAVAANLAAESQRMLAPNNGYVVDPLEDRRATYERTVALFAKAAQSEAEAD